MNTLLQITLTDGNEPEQVFPYIDTAAGLDSAMDACANWMHDRRASGSPEATLARLHLNSLTWCYEWADEIIHQWQ